MKRAKSKSEFAVVIGTIMDGFEFYGPLNEEKANSFADDVGGWVVKLLDASDV
jgi:hypothetical protein